MKKFKVYGRIRADLTFEEIVEAKTEDEAIKIVDDKNNKQGASIKYYEIIDDEIYCDEIEDKRA